MPPLIISNDLRIPSIETASDGGGGGVPTNAMQFEDNIETNSFILLEDNIDTGFLLVEDNI